MIALLREYFHSGMSQIQLTAYGRFPSGRARAIPLYLVGRGLQMFVRMERFGVRDEIQPARVQWLHEHRAWLEEVVASAI